MAQRKIRRIVQVHPPDAERIAAEFTHARSIVSELQDRLQTVRAALENNWSGRAEGIFTDELTIEKNTLNQIVPLLDGFIGKYHRYQVDVEIEEVIADGAP